MPIILTCHCGRTLRAKDDQAGRACRCPACGSTLQVPYPVAKAVDPPPDGSKFLTPDNAPPTSALSAALNIHRAADQIILRTAAPRVAAPDLRSPTLSDLQKTERTWRGHVYFILLLAFIPLIQYTFTPNDTQARLQKLLEQNSESRPKFQGGGIRHSLDEILDQLPGHRLEGALFARDGYAYLIFPAITAVIFFAIIACAIPSDEVEPHELFLYAAFTATIGVALLLTFQYFSICFCLVGIWYIAALSPGAPFGPSLLGFILGVGVCEEITKCLPVLWRLRHFEITWRGACLVGMASGAGFGIAEGIHYCDNFYNGVATLSIYLVRFTSDVAFHVMLSGACGIMIFRQRKHLGTWIHPYDWMLTMTAIMFVPIILHGLFDTLLKEKYEPLALLTWLAAFVWLAWLITNSRNKEVEEAKKSMAGATKVIKTEKGTRYVGG